MHLFHLYEYRTPDGELKEIIADAHVPEYDFYQECKRRYNVILGTGSIKQKWQTTVMNKRKFHDTKVAYSYPVTIGIVK